MAATIAGTSKCCATAAALLIILCSIQANENTYSFPPVVQQPGAGILCLLPTNLSYTFPLIMFKKYLVLFFLLLAMGSHAQTALTFDKRFVECEDKWVVFRPDKDGTYHYGFIYIDDQAGLTHQVGGKFIIAKDGTYVRIPQGLDSTSIKVRLQPNQVRVALLPPAAFASLKIKATPEWLHFYKTDTVSVKHLYRWGFLYNSWDEPAKALTYLQRAQQLDPNFSGLAPELAYTYNALQQYDKAIPIAVNSLKTAPDNCYTYKELSYAQLQLGQPQDAVATYQKSVSLCTDKEMKSEIAFNITGHYYRVKDRSNFDYWAKETEKWATKGDKFATNLASMRATFPK